MTLETTARAHAQISLVDLLDRLLGTGIDLVRVQLEALITSVRSELAPDAHREAGSDGT
jgi:hypothetical protein